MPGVKYGIRETGLATIWWCWCPYNVNEGHIVFNHYHLPASHHSPWRTSSIATHSQRNSRLKNTNKSIVTATVPGLMQRHLTFRTKPLAFPRPDEQDNAERSGNVLQNSRTRRVSRPTNITWITSHAPNVFVSKINRYKYFGHGFLQSHSLRCPSAAASISTRQTKWLFVKIPQQCGGWLRHHTTIMPSNDLVCATTESISGWHTIQNPNWSRRHALNFGLPGWLRKSCTMVLALSKL